jgi:hypothetical protein
MINWIQTTGIDWVIVWMLNLYLNSIHLTDNIGESFPDLKDKARGFAIKYLLLYERAYVMNGFRRTGVEHFPIIDTLKREQY